MKKLASFLIASLSLSACTYNWEYKVVTVEGTTTTDYAPRTYDVANDDLNLFGKEGWELVDVYTITETVHPNFGNAEYVTGIRENTRTRSVNYVFKRKI